MADYSTRRGGLRAKLPLQVLKGFYPTEPVKLSSLAEPVNVNDIKSGMAIVKDANGKWIRAQVADATNGKSIYIALTDADALDVQASGKLVGLDCSDKFELQTGYFDAAEIWAVGDLLTVGANGTLVKLDPADYVGSTITAVGEITAIGPAAADGGTDERIIPYVGFTPSCAAADATLIQFKTVERTVASTGV